MNTNQRRRILRELSNQITEETLQEEGMLADQCKIASIKLRKRAAELGIELRVQGGLFKGFRVEEHNWCVDVENGDIYDPTAEQFYEGINGLVPKSKLDFYIPMSRSEGEHLRSIARQEGWTLPFIERISQLAMGYLYREQRRALLEKVRKVYPDLTHVVRSGPSEIKTAKNGSRYAIIREPEITFEFSELEVREWNNGLIVSGTNIRSWVVFENTNGSYSIQAINQRAFVSKNGKSGILTKRGEKITIKFNKTGQMYYTKRVEGGYKNVTLSPNSDASYEFHMYADFIQDFKKLS